MKFGKVGQVGLVSAIALVVATLFTACGSLTVGFLYVATNKQTPGQIEVYEVNSESGVLRTIPTSPFPSGGRNPVAEAVSPDFKNLYVVNADDNAIVQMGIGTDGKIYPQTTVNTPGSFPMAVAVNSAGKFLFVVDTLQPVAGCSLTNPCPADIAVYPLNPDGSLGTVVANNQTYPTFWPLIDPAHPTTVLTPTAVNLLANGNTVYVSAYNSSTNVGYVFAFSVSSSGALTALDGGKPLMVGSQPVSLASDSSSAYLYVADKLNNLVDVYAVQADGSLSSTPQSTVSTGSAPTGLVLNGTSFLYVTNSGDSNVTGYSVASGHLTKVSSNATDIDPVAVILDPRNVGYLYTVNFLGNSLSGFKIDPKAGTLINAQNSPYASSVQPTAIVGIPHGGTIK